MRTGSAAARPTRKGTTERASDSRSEEQRRIDNLTRPPKVGSGKILTMRQLRKMASIMERRMFRDAKGAPKYADRKHSTVSFGVLTDKLVILAPHDQRAVVEHDGSPEITAAIRDLGLRIASIGATPPSAGDGTT